MKVVESVANALGVDPGLLIMGVFWGFMLFIAIISDGDDGKGCFPQSDSRHWDEMQKTWRKHQRDKTREEHRRGFDRPGP